MKKSIILILLIMILSVSAYGADRVDMIVLLDNSVSVLPHYDSIQNSLIKKVISEHLSPGDTFSLITFADYPEVEISREIRNEEDIREILTYSSILQPMGNHTDLILALRFLYKYTLDLPLSNKKKIIILTDGIHDPPEGSPFIFDSPGEIENEVRKASAEIHREGWDVSIIEVETADSILIASDGKQNVTPDVSSEDNPADFSDPASVSGDAGDAGNADRAGGENTTGGSTNVMNSIADSLGSTPNKFDDEAEDMAAVALGIPLIGVPEHVGGTVDGRMDLPLSILNRGNEVLLFSVSAVMSDGRDILSEKRSIKLKPAEQKVLELPISLDSEDDTAGEQSAVIKLKLVGGLKTEPAQLVLNYRFEEKSSITVGIGFITDWRVIAVIAAIIVAVIVIILIKRSSFSAGGVYLAENGEVIKPAKPVPAGTIKSGNEQDEEEAREIESADSTRREPEEYLIAAITSDTEQEQDERGKKNRPVQMLVYGQNTKLGISNVKWLGLNRKRSVGSSSSSVFKIFFLKVPHVIANIECTGDDFIFYPEKKEFFPDINEPLHNCLNRKIRIVNSDNKMFYIEFRQWISELEKVNRLLSMTKKRGTPNLNFR